MQGNLSAASIAFLSLLTALWAAPAGAQTDERKALAFKVIDRNADPIALVGDTIYYFGELGMQEFESAKFVKQTLEAIGFTVETGGAGMPTNVWAHWGTGKPQVVVVSEIDALPSGSQTPGSIARKPLVQGAPGHMEGHNTHASVAIGAAYAVKQVMQRFKIPGTVAISFGPAEEQIISRPYLVRAGQFKDADAAIVLHIGDQSTTGFGLYNYAAISAKFTFHGKTAHAATAPWEGRDAVDAVELMDIGLDKLREHLRPTYRVHRAITQGGVQPNIIPDVGQIWYFVRDANFPAAKETYDKLLKIAEGAALMTGTTYEVEVNAAAWPQLANKTIGEAIQKNIEMVGMPRWDGEEEAFAREFQRAQGVPQIGLRQKPTPFGGRPQTAASNDNGDVTWVVPTGAMAFPASVPGISYHNWQAAVTPTMSIAHKGMVVGAKVMAASLIDLLSSTELRQKARAEFEQETAKTKYFSVLPADAKPPLDLNKEMMEHYRPAMRKFYLNKQVQFK